MHEFESIRPIVDSISKQYLGTEYKVDNKAVHGKIELGQIDMVSFCGIFLEFSIEF